MPIEVTDQYIRVRVRNPDDFVEGSLRTVWLSEDEGIKRISGRLKREPTKWDIQAFLFVKEKWTPKSAEKWVRDHGHAPKSIDEMTISRIDEYEIKSLRTDHLKQIEPPENGDGLKWELIIEAWASTPDPDRANEIVVPTAFARTMPKFMATQPVMMFNHDPAWTIGRILEYRIEERGLWVKGGILPTERGKEVATMIRFGSVNSMSFRFRVLEREDGEEGKPSKIKDLDVFEIGPVSIPMNTEAVIEDAKAKGILKSTAIGDAAGDHDTKENSTMEIKEVQTIVGDAIKPVADKTTATEVKIGDIKKEVDNLSKLLSELRQASESGTKTSGELREFVDRVVGEFTKRSDELTEQINKIKIQKSVVGIDPMGLKFEDVMALMPLQADAMYPQKAGLIKEAQRYWDGLMIKDAFHLGQSRTSGGSYHLQPFAERVKDFADYRHLNEFRKALDTATATEGAEFIHTDLSGTIRELIQLQLKVGPLFEQIEMTGKTFKLEFQLADIIATKHGESTTVVTGWDSTEQTPTTGAASLTAVKLRARVQLSNEVIEDSAAPIVPWVQRRASNAIWRGIDRMIVAGQATADIDTGYSGLGATDARKVCDGLRYHIQNNVPSAAKIDCGTFSEENLAKVQAAGEQYFIYPDEAAIITSAKVILQKLFQLTSVRTLDKYGPNATVLSGELGKYNNIPVIASEFVQNDLNASGIYDGSTTTQSEIIFVNRNAWVLGYRRALDVKVVPDPINDVFTVVAFWRGDFKPIWTPAAGYVTVNHGYNIGF